MKRKTEDHGTTLTTWEMLTPNLKFKFTTYKEPGQIITTASCRTVYSNGSERYSYGSEYMVEVDRTWHKRVTAPMVQSHHRSDVANLYDIYLKRAITWNVARDKMPAPLTEEEQALRDAALLQALNDVGISASTVPYLSGTMSTSTGMRIIESNPVNDSVHVGRQDIHQAHRGTTYNDGTTGTVRELLEFYVSQRTPLT